MLTADLVRGRCKEGELRLTPLRGAARTRALELGEAVLEVATSLVGRSREELEEAWASIESLARERRLLDGLRKLAVDLCVFETHAVDDAAALRREVFTRSTELWRGREAGESFDRLRVLEAVAAETGLTPDAIDGALYADLRGAHLLARAPRVSGTQLVQRYEQAQIQAVLLRAEKVTAVVSASPLVLRDLFRQIKFRRLLCEIHPESGRHRLEIDGPLSLFGQVTKYGLQLALLLPALEQCAELDLEARVQWGKQRRRVLFRHHSRRRSDAQISAAGLPAEVEALREAFAALETPWEVAVADRVLDLPGLGTIVPDLCFTRPECPQGIYLEVLGYWSREAVWRRVELAQAGLGARVLFAVSRKLRVSHEVLDDTDSAALYVFKGSLSARAVERHLDALLAASPD